MAVPFLPDEVKLNICRHSDFASLATMARVGLFSTVATEVLYKRDGEERPGKAVVWGCLHRRVGTVTKSIEFCGTGQLSKLVYCKELQEADIVPMHAAAAGGCIQIIDILLQHGADIDTMAIAYINRAPGMINTFDMPLTLTEYTPLCVAILFGQDAAAEHLIAHGASIWSMGSVDQDFMGFPIGPSSVIALHIACLAGSMPLIASLINNHGVFVNLTDDIGRDPLHWAVLSENSIQVCLYLLSRGADATAADWDRKTPLHFLGKNPEWGAPTALVPALVNAGANVNAEDSIHWTPYCYAVARANPEAMAALLVHNANADAMIVHGPDRAPFHILFDALTQFDACPVPVRKEQLVAGAAECLRIVLDNTHHATYPLSEQFFDLCLLAGFRDVAEVLFANGIEDTWAHSLLLDRFMGVWQVSGRTRDEFPWDTFDWVMEWVDAVDPDLAFHVRSDLGDHLL